MDISDKSTALVDLDRIGAVWEQAMGHDGNGRDVAVWMAETHREHPALTGFALNDAVLKAAFAGVTWASQSEAMWLAVASNTISAMFHDWQTQRVEWLASKPIDAVDAHEMDEEQERLENGI